MEGGREEAPNKRPRLATTAPAPAEGGEQEANARSDGGSGPQSAPGTWGSPAEPNGLEDEEHNKTDKPAAHASHAELEAASPLPPVRALQLMVESHVTSGSKNTRVVRLAAGATVADLFDALLVAEGLPPSSAPLQRLWGGSRTLSMDDARARLEDVGISEGHQRILRHFLARTGSPLQAIAPELREHLAESEQLPRSAERKNEFLQALRSAHAECLNSPVRRPAPPRPALELARDSDGDGGIRPAPRIQYGDTVMENSLLLACARGDDFAALALALHGAKWGARDAASGLAAPALFADQLKDGDCDPLKLVARLELTLTTLAMTVDDEELSDAERSRTSANRFALDILRAAGAWRDFSGQQALEEAQRLSELCETQAAWRRFLGRLMRQGPSEALHPYTLAFFAASTFAEEWRLNAIRLLEGKGAPAVHALLAVFDANRGAGAAATALRARVQSVLLNPALRRCYEAPAVAEALLSAATRAAGGHRRHGAGVLPPRSLQAGAPLAALLRVLCGPGRPGVRAYAASPEAARQSASAPLLPLRVLSSLEEAAGGLHSEYPPETAAALLDAIAGHPPTRAAVASTLVDAAAAALGSVYSELHGFAAAAAPADREGRDEDEEEEEGEERRPIEVQPAAEQQLRALERAARALRFDFDGADEDREAVERQARAADVALRLAAAAAAALRALAPTLRSAFLLGCPALLSSKPAEFVWRCMAAGAALAGAAGVLDGFADSLRPFRGLLSDCVQALIAGRAFRGSSLAAAVGRVPGAVRPHLRRQASRPNEVGPRVRLVRSRLTSLRSQALVAELVVGPSPAGRALADGGEDEEEGYEEYEDAGPAPLELAVSRGSLIDSSIASLGADLLLPSGAEAAGGPGATAEGDFRRAVANMQVTFRGEEAHGPGVLREYFACLARELLDPQAALFRRHDDAAGVYYPSSDARVHPSHLSMFRLCGWAMGAAFATGAVFPVYFPECLYGYLLGRPLGLPDLASLEPTIARALQNDVLGRGVEDLGMVFAVDEVFFGEHRTVPLRPGGETEPVTDANKGEYVQLAVEYYIVGRVRQELEALREGLRRVLPAAATAALLPGELRAIVEGRAEVDVADWRRHTRYGNGLSADSQEVAWFWDYVEALTAAGRARLLAFATGSPRAPPGGFAHLVASSGRQEPFQLVREDREGPGRLPTAHTCFNQLVLPRYASPEALRAALDAAIGADHGFGFA
eukprot:tig00020510_g9858.t1